MDSLIVTLIGVGALFWSGHQLARRKPALGSMLAVILLAGAFVLVQQDLSPASLGEGAPSSAGAFLGMLWLLEFAFILLAGTMLAAGWRAAGHAMSRNLLFFVFAPFCAYALLKALPASYRSASTGTPAQPVATEPTGTRLDGYTWAVDSDFRSDGDCHGASPEFVAGCKEGVAKNRERASK